ncbi:MULTISPECIES: hypothetical protein [Sphingomonas]|jgi:hypothetical protein|nr:MULTISPECIES: hypothetical protein [Sphingomonas]MBB3588618.1 hypothetical protein [Sphingomonas sp. BK481]MBM7407705.1 hypothetical protein [Sphingomonas sp. JUb134]RSV29500.1 hypothetical protein CA237_08795 [Sphingomonas sp. ABOLH]HEX2019620.1 hypothetical protein [Aurantimonas sp.]
MRHPRSALLGAVLALVAMLGLIGLSGWHNAIVHDDDAIHASVIEHSHDTPEKSDPDAPIHVLAHATGHWVAFDGALPSERMILVADRQWMIGTARLPGGIDPAEFLRPPRA